MTNPFAIPIMKPLRSPFLDGGICCVGSNCDVEVDTEVVEEVTHPEVNDGAGTEEVNAKVLNAEEPSAKDAYDGEVD